MTDADRIARLEEENAWLRRELGDMVTANELRDLRRAIPMEPKQAKLILRLYHARGRVVTHAQLADTLGPEGTISSVKVHFSRLRHLFGQSLVENAYGLGYALTPQAIRLVAAALDYQRTQQAA